MHIVRHENITLPKTDNGYFLSKNYAEEMKRKGYEVTIIKTKNSIIVKGYFIGELKDSFITHLRKK